MNEKDYISDLENTIRNVVNDIRTSRDFRNIKSDVQDIGSRVANEVNEGIRAARQAYEDFSDNQKSSREHTEYRPNYSAPRAYSPKYAVNTKVQTQVAKVPSQSAAGILFTVFGSILTFVFTVSSFVMLIMKLATGAGLFFDLFLLLTAFNAVGIVMLASGIKKINRISRFKKYAKAIGASEFVPVKQLGEATGRRNELVCRDLNDMLKSRCLEKAVFDDKKEYVFFNDTVYNQYLEAMKKQSEQQKDERKRREAAENSDILKNGWQSAEELSDIIAKLDGEVCMKAQSLYNEAVKILKFVTDHPDRADEIKKFSSYYLPSAVGILNTYIKFETQQMASGDIDRAKDEIENMLDVSTTAFKNLLDSLYDDDAMDVSTDIAAMQAMMAQEGLIDSFTATNKNEEDIKL